MVSAMYKDIKGIVEVLHSPQAIYEIIVFCVGNIHLIFLASLISSKTRVFYVKFLENLYKKISSKEYEKLDTKIDNISNACREMLANNIEYDCVYLLKQDKIYRNNMLFDKIKKKHVIYKNMGGNGEIDKIVQKVIDRSIDDIG